MNGAQLNTLRGRDGGDSARPARREVRRWVGSSEQGVTKAGARCAPSRRVAAASRARIVLALGRSDCYAQRTTPREHALAARNAAHGGH